MGHHPELIKNMLNYIIIEPDEIESDYKKCYKFFISLYTITKTLIFYSLHNCYFRSHTTAYNP